MTRRVDLVVFDVNETLSDLRPLARRFSDRGCPEHVLDTWFAGVLRDGFAATAAGTMVTFAAVASSNLRDHLAAVGRAPETLREDVAHILGGFGDLDVHPDVPAGMRALQERGVRMAALTNGSTSLSEPMFARAGVLEMFERRLSVEDVGRWKPAPEPYRYAVQTCEVDPARAALVAVHPWDVHGAQRAGLLGVWVNRRAASYPAYLPPPDLEVDGLVPLASRLTDRQR